jgi:hypothetical protein
VRATRDTFLMLLKDNLSSSIPVKNIRFDKNDASAEFLSANTVNVKFQNAGYSNVLSDQTVTIDIVHDDELTALDWTKAVTDILLANTTAPKLDYTNPASPVATGTQLYWDPRIRFTPITDGNYARFSASMLLRHRSI